MNTTFASSFRPTFNPALRFAGIKDSKLSQASMPVFRLTTESQILSGFSQLQKYKSNSENLITANGAFNEADHSHYGENYLTTLIPYGKGLQHLAVGLHTFADPESKSFTLTANKSPEQLFAQAKKHLDYASTTTKNRAEIKVLEKLRAYPGNS